MKKTLSTLLIAIGLLAAGPGLAADPHAGHAMPAGSKDAAAATDELSEGTVKKVDLAAGRITIVHGPLKNLGMPAMTMVFKAADPAQLKGVKAGDSIRFVAGQVGNDYVASRIQLRK